jgi:hypothetical protein
LELFPEPRSPEASELTRLAGVAANLERRVREIEGERAAATRAAMAASQALTELEHRKASVEAVPDAHARKIEKEFRTTKERGEAPFAEKLAGTKEALRRANGAVQSHASRCYSALAGELAEDGVEVAREADAALAALLDVYHRRAAVAQRSDALVALVRGRSTPGLVPTSRLERVAVEADAALLAGGEAPPQPPPTLRPTSVAEVPDEVEVVA